MAFGLSSEFRKTKEKERNKGFSSSSSRGCGKGEKSEKGRDHGQFSAFFLHRPVWFYGGRGRDKSGQKGKRGKRETQGGYPPENPRWINGQSAGLSTGRSGKRKGQFLISSIIPLTRAANSGSVVIMDSTRRNAAIMVEWSRPKISPMVLKVTSVS